jgi:hypothetical protein
MGKCSREIPRRPLLYALILALTLFYPATVLVHQDRVGRRAHRLSRPPSSSGAPSSPSASSCRRLPRIRSWPASAPSAPSSRSGPRLVADSAQALSDRRPADRHHRAHGRFAKGVIDTKDLVYYLSVIAFALFPDPALARVQAVAGIGRDVHQALGHVGVVTSASGRRGHPLHSLAHPLPVALLIAAAVLFV